ncbi:MAG: hypothetical protein IKA02_01780, partial [Clostridia bacterium]|nr:hypothetical protein [Clostridia bacterium]
MSGDENLYNKFVTTVNSVGEDEELNAKINESIVTDISKYAKKIAKSLLANAEFAKVQVEFIKKYADSALESIDGEFVNVLTDEMDNVVQMFITGDNKYNLIKDVLNERCKDGLTVIENGISDYVISNASQIATKLVKEDSEAKSLYEKLKSSDKETVKTAIESYFNSKKTELADGVIKNDKNSIREINVIESYVKGITSCIKDVMRDNIGKKAEEYAKGILNNDKDALAIYNDFDSDEKNIVNTSIVDIIERTAEENLKKLFAGDHSCVAIFRIACEKTPNAKNKIIEGIQKYVTDNRIQIVNDLINGKEVTKKAFDVIMEYTESVQEVLREIILRQYKNKKNERLTSFSGKGYEKEDHTASRWSKICPEVEILFNSWIKEYYFSEENKKSTAKEYVDGKSTGRFEIIKRRLPDFDLLIGDAVYSVYKEQFDSLLEQVYTGNANKALAIIDKYEKYSSKISKNELYEELMKYFEDYKIWKNLFISDSKILNSLNLLVKTSYTDQLKDSFHKYLLSDQALEDGYTIDRGIEKAKEKHLDAIVSEKELYDIVLTYDKSKINDSVLRFMKRYVGNSGDTKEERISEVAYQMLFDEALG